MKKSLLLICKILRLFAHTFPADDKYSLPNRDNLTQSVQIQFSQKQNPFSPFFDKVFKFGLNFEHFQIKDDADSQCISEITNFEKRG